MSNVSAVRKGTGGGPTVVFAAHMDTVFPEGTNVTVTRDGDVLRGPGVGDDTSNLMATLEMFRALDRGGVKTKGDLIFLATAQEELGLVGARHWLETSGYKPDMFIAVDLSAEDVWYGALRITQYKFFYTSPGAHTLESRDAPSPAKAVSQAIAALYEIPLPPVAAGLGSFKLPVLNVGMLGGGTVFNAIPREAWFSVDLRSLDTQHPDASSSRRSRAPRSASPIARRSGSASRRRPSSTTRRRAPRKTASTARSSRPRSPPPTTSASRARRPSSRWTSAPPTPTPPSPSASRPWRSAP